MELNSFMFPAPRPSYSLHTALGDLLFIPRRPNKDNHSSSDTADSDND